MESFVFHNIQGNQQDEIIIIFSKFIDVLRMKCLKLHSVVLSDGQYYELVRSNFERADRMSVVR